MKNKKIIIVIVAIVLVFIVVQRIRFLASDEPSAVDPPEVATEETEDKTEGIASAIDGAIGENESISNVTIKDKELRIVVDLSQMDTALNPADLAVSRAGSITDALLDHPEYDDLWETVVIDFGDIGTVTRAKADIAENEYDMRYFEINGLD